MSATQNSVLVLSQDEISRSLTRISHEIVENPENYEDLYKITRTSSPFASLTEDNKNEDDTVLASMKKNDYFGVSFVGRGPARMLLRVVYKLYRVTLISVWYYFLPFVAMLGSYLVPFMI